MKIGDTYERNRFEVQYLSDNGNWLAMSRHSKTIEEARKSIQDHKQVTANLRWLINLEDNHKLRIVKVTATCEVVEIL